MSQSETRVAPRSVGLALLGSELRVLFGRRRTWAMLAALAAIPILIAVAVRLSSSPDSPGDGPAFLSSHLLAEVEQVCTHVAVMSTGRLVAQGSLDELRAQGTARVVVQTPDVGDARRVLVSLGLAPDTDDGLTTDSVSAELPAGVHAETVTAALVRADVRVRGLAVAGASLEDRFVALTGEGFDVAE